MSVGDVERCGVGQIDAECVVEGGAYGSAGACRVSSGRGGRCFCVAGIEQAVGGGPFAIGDALDPFGHGAGVQKAGGQGEEEKAGGHAGPPGLAAADARADRPSVEHRAKCCPDCGGRLKGCGETRTRYTEDIPDIEPEVTEHTIHRDWCPRRRKKVEPPVPDALPGSTLGLRVLVLSAWLHYALGNKLSHIVEVFNFHLQMKLTEGGLVQMWYRLQEILFAWYDEIREEALESAVLQGDETGWRVDGKTRWLW